MEAVAFFSENHDYLLYLIAGVSFILELTIMGLGGPLLFFAMASLITGGLVSLGIISGWELIVFSLGVFTLLISLVLWKPLKNFQNSGGGADTSSDMIGKQVSVSSQITPIGGKIRYSGIDWNARLVTDCSVDSIEENVYCEIAAVDGNVMLVKPL
jgi:membrane protein implicated in regulation of membrane protease activity